MKTFLTALMLVSSFAASAVTLESFGVHRTGGGQLDAIVTNSDEGPEVTLLKCSFRAVSSDLTKKITDVATIKEVQALMNGTAIIATDVTPTELMPTGSWNHMSYTVAMMGGDAVKVQKPIIIINGKVSNVLAKVEAIARKLCK